MSLTLPLAITVGADSIAAPRTLGPDGRKAHYEWMRTDGSRLYTAIIAHNVPKVSTGLESHQIRLDAQDYDTDGVAGRKHSVWIQFQTVGGFQDVSNLSNMYLGVTGNLEAASLANLAAILNREL